jgi:hypothetical protein
MAALRNGKLLQHCPGWSDADATCVSQDNSGSSSSSSASVTSWLSDCALQTASLVPVTGCPAGCPRKAALL